jgi:signal transduction histidine kinase
MTQFVKKSNIPKDAAEYVYHIEEASNHLLQLIHDLLDVSGRNDGAFELEESVFSFEKMFWEATKDIRKAVLEKKLKLSYDIDSKIPDKLIGDDRNLARVIKNIMSNAVKFTPSEGKIHFAASVQRDGDEAITLKVEVTDSGIGISKEKQKGVFDIFEQVDGSHTSRHGGIGLGLPMAEFIVNAMGGKIWVDSELGKGSKFTFTCKLRKQKP